MLAEAAAGKMCRGWPGEGASPYTSLPGCARPGG